MIIDEKKKPEAAQDSGKPQSARPAPGAKEGGQDSMRSALLERAKRSEDESQRLAAVSELAGDAGALKEIIMETPYRDARGAAAELAIGNEAAAIELLTSENKVASSAILDKLMRTPGKLLDLAKSSMNPEARGIALDKLRDEEQLVEIAKYSIYADSRAGALGKLGGNARAVEEVAASSSYSDTRLGALMLIKADGEALSRVEGSSLYEDTRKEARAMMPELRKRP